MDTGAEAVRRDIPVCENIQLLYGGEKFGDVLSESQTSHTSDVGSIIEQGGKT